jgi:hypothetical protein
MNRVGDEQAGYSITLDAVNGTIRVRAWGFWSVEVATTFGKNVGDVCVTAPQGTALHLDMKGLKPMREEGQHSFGMLLNALPSLRMSATTIATDNPLTKLQLLRLANKHGAKDAVQFV